MEATKLSFFFKYGTKEVQFVSSYKHGIKY